jgi:hypothetical protein
VLRIGQLVMLVGSEGNMPPFGAYGEIIGYEHGDYEVLFPKYPCPNPPGITWLAAPNWLMPVNPDDSSVSDDQSVSAD